MPKPITEHSTSFGGGGKTAPPKPVSHETVLKLAANDGHVRRVEFEAAGTPGARTDPTIKHINLRNHDSIEDIRFEIDNLDRIRRGGAPRARAPRERPATRRVFETRGGAVNAAQMETERGERRVLYTSKKQGNAEHETRFHSGLVDRIIAEKYQGGPRFETADQMEEKVGLFGRKKDTSEGKVEMVKRGVKPKKAKTSKAAKPDKKPEALYQPQCGAVTRDGMQCRNSSKTGTDYCGAHQTYSPRSIEDLLDTQPARGDDKKPGSGDLSGTGQCAAYTKDSLQCRNRSANASKYCGSHKSYRAPNKAALSKSIDTEPRFKNAPDTLPKFR